MRWFAGGFLEFWWFEGIDVALGGVGGEKVVEGGETGRRREKKKGMYYKKRRGREGEREKEEGRSKKEVVKW